MPTTHTHAPREDVAMAAIRAGITGGSDPGALPASTDRLARTALRDCLHWLDVAAHALGYGLRPSTAPRPDAASRIADTLLALSVAEAAARAGKLKGTVPDALLETITDARDALT